jgi:hypothetical protein
MPASDAWPPLPYDEWEPTKQTLHRYCQIVGKIRMALVPARNHWWHVTLYPTTRGLSTGPMPHGDRDVEIAFDLVDHRLELRSSDGRGTGFDLTARPACADFYADLFGALGSLDVDVTIHPEPFDLGDSPPLHADRENDSYDPGAVHRFWRVLAATQRVLVDFEGSFNGKVSPVHLFWHGFDLAHARYSGKRAPASGDVDRITAEAYSHEVIAFGFWPGDSRTTPFPAFYSYTAPEPAALRHHVLEPAEARWQDAGSGSLAVLPYESVRSAPDPHATLKTFFGGAYLAGARAAGWDLEGFTRTP